MLKKENIVRITFSNAKTTLLQKEQLNVIQPLSYKKVSTSKQQWDFPVRDTSSNDTSSATTLRRNFLSNYQFVKKSLRRMHFRRIRHLVEIFPELGGPKYLLDAMHCWVFWSCVYHVKLETSRLKPFQLLNFRRKLTYTIKIIHSLWLFAKWNNSIVCSLCTLH